MQLESNNGVNKLKLICFYFVVMCTNYLSIAQPLAKAEELEFRATNLYQHNRDDKEIMKEVLRLYDQAIQADSLYINAYWNKASVLKEHGRCQDALLTLDKLAIRRPDIIGPISEGGFILEVMGNKNEANKRYLIDITKLDSTISKEMIL